MRWLALAWLFAVGTKRTYTQAFATGRGTGRPTRDVHGVSNIVPSGALLVPKSPCVSQPCANGGTCKPLWERSNVLWQAGSAHRRV